MGLIRFSEKFLKSRITIMKNIVLSANFKEMSIDELMIIDTPNNSSQTIGADIKYNSKTQKKFLSAVFAILITSNTPISSNNNFVNPGVQIVKTISNIEDVDRIIDTITPVTLEYPIIKKERVLIDDEENRIEENILNTYISVVGDFITSRKKKISL